MSNNDDAPTDAPTEPATPSEVHKQVLASILSTIQKHQGILGTFRGESDRGAILVAASFLDSTLERLLQAAFIHDAGALAKRMFSPDGPMGAFSARIDLALAMGLIHSNTAANLHRVRRIRNACAHSPESVDFDTQSIRDLTNAMWQVDSFIPAEIQNGSSRALTRARFLMNASIAYGQLLLILRNAESTKREQLWLAHQMRNEVASVKLEEAKAGQATTEVRIAELEQAIEANVAEYARTVGITIDEARARLNEAVESEPIEKVDE